MRQSRSTWAKIMDNHNTHGWIIAALLREMPRLTGKATFECVECSLVFNRCLRQGSAEALRLWQKMATQIWATVEEWMKKGKGVLLDVEGEGGEVHQICGFMWADNFWVMSHCKKHLKQMLKDLIEEAAEMDLEPKPVSLWWTSTCASEEKEDMILGSSKACVKFPFEDEFRILGCMMNRQGKTCDAVEERVQSANKVFWM